MFKLAVILITLTAVCAAPPIADNTDIDALIEDVFGPKSSNSGDIGTPTGAPTTKANDEDEDGIECTTTASGEKGVCVKYYLCTQPSNTSRIDIAFNEEDCPSYLQVCCLSKYIDD